MSARRWAESAAARLWGGDLSVDLERMRRLGAPPLRLPGVSDALERAFIAGARACAPAADDPAGRALIDAAPGALPVLVIGDSHSTHWVRRSARDGRWLLPLQQLHTGATARGLGRAASASGAGERAAATIAATTWPVILKFGQVDLEFVYTYKRLDGPKPYDPAHAEAFALAVAEAYAGWLAELPRRERVHVAGVFPPALSDAAWRTGYVNAHIAQMHGPADLSDLSARLRAVEIPPLAERTRIHDLFNEALAESCDRLGLPWLDDAAAVRVAGGRVLGRGGGHDHHLNYAATGPVMLPRLWEVAT